MSQPTILYQWWQMIRTQFVELSKPQTWLLAMFSLGIARSQRCNLRPVASALPWLGKPDTVERRLQRFLANSRLQVQGVAATWARWVLSSLVVSGRVVLLVDETHLQERLGVMAVSLAYRGRAIPLAWRCYHPKAWPDRQVPLIRDLLRQVAAALPEGCQVLVQADRGIGTSPSLLRTLQQWGWSFLVRVQHTTRLRLADGQEIRFGDCLQAPGQTWRAEVAAFKKAGWLHLWAIAYWGVGHKEPWLLLTNCPSVQATTYGVRMWEELAFRDLKSNGWQWQRSRVWVPERAERLWLVMALAYAWMLSLGTYAWHHYQHRRQLSRGRTQRLSLFQLGLAMFHRWLDLEKPLLCHFLLIPEPFIEVQKSVVQ